MATLAGLVAGFGALWLVRERLLDAGSLRVARMYGEQGKVRPGFEEIVNAGCFSHAAGDGGVADRENRFVFFLERFRDMALLVGKFLFAALLIQAAVTYYVPVNAVEPLLGRGSALSVLLATLVSVPLPLPQIAAPALVKGLLAAGMSPGAGWRCWWGAP